MYPACRIDNVCVEPSGLNTRVSTREPSNGKISPRGIPAGRTQKGEEFVDARRARHRGPLPLAG